MEYEIRDMIEYIIALVNSFAKQFNLSEKQAYRYLHIHKGISFLRENYSVIHTLDFQEALESVTLYCRKKGGRL